MLNTDKRLVQYAKKLVQISIEDGRVSDERVKAIMGTFASRPPRRFKTILKLYLYYIKRELRKSQAVIEYAGSINKSSIETIERNLTSHYGRPITVTLSENQELLAGIRISVADDVYDSTIAGSLNNLSGLAN